MAQYAKAIVAVVAIVAGAAGQAITAQCGHPLNYAALVVATAVGAFAVWRIPNATPSAPPAQPGVGG